MAVVTLQELNEASVDVATLEAFINGPASPGTVTTRLGQVLKTLARIQGEVQAAAAVPIWAACSCSALGTASIAAQSGGFTIAKDGDDWKVSHPSFTVNTRVQITQRYTGAALPALAHYSSATGYILVRALNAGANTFFTSGFGFTLTTFPQML